MFIASDHDPLGELPAELSNASLEVMAMDRTSEVLDHRHFLFRRLRYAPAETTTATTPGHIWRIIVPYRPALTLIHGRRAGTRGATIESYEWIIRSLTSWFRDRAFDRSGYCQWTMATLIECMQSDDLGPRLSQFRAASRVLDDLLRLSGERDLSLLRLHLSQRVHE